jgi:D-alanyl-D-alanine carboxypeptidase
MMETTIPPTGENQHESSVTPKTSRTLGITALLLIAAASGAFTFAYFNSTPASAPAQTASSAEPIVNPYESLALVGKSVMVIDLKNGKTLYAKNASTPLPLASLTKVPMALVVSQVLPLDSTITIPYDTAPRGSSERLAAGDTWKVKDIINFTLIASSNDGAEILANAANDEIHRRYSLSPAEGATVWRMNQFAKGLGLRDMYFLNPSGLDLSTTQSGAYGSAFDVARLFAYAASTSPEVFGGTARDGLLLTSVNGGKTMAFNTNTALGSIPGLIMGKTGYTDLAGGNLAIVFDVGPAHPIVAVVLGSTEEGRFDDMKKLVTATEEAVANE